MGQGAVSTSWSRGCRVRAASGKPRQKDIDIPPLAPGMTQALAPGKAAGQKNPLVPRINKALDNPGANNPGATAEDSRQRPWIRAGQVELGGRTRGRHFGATQMPHRASTCDPARHRARDCDPAPQQVILPWLSLSRPPCSQPNQAGAAQPPRADRIYQVRAMAAGATPLPILSVGVGMLPPTRMWMRVVSA